MELRQLRAPRNHSDMAVTLGTSTEVFCLVAGLSDKRRQTHSGTPTWVASGCMESVAETNFSTS